jgi:single-strand DNA-binding protein
MFLNEAQVSLTGYVATQPVARTVKSGASNLSMRVAWTPRRQDRVSGEWVDGNTSYVTVICWRKLATNAGVCVRKGDPVIVKGRLSIRAYEDKQGAQRIAVEIEASAVGHDLSRGVAQFQRVRPQTGLTASEFASSNGGEPQAEGGESGYRAGAEGVDRGVPELTANGHLPGAGDEAVLSLNDFTVPDGLGVEDPFFDESGNGEQARDREPAAAPF